MTLFPSLLPARDDMTAGPVHIWIDVRRTDCAEWGVVGGVSKPLSLYKRRVAKRLMASAKQHPTASTTQPTHSTFKHVHPVLFPYPRRCPCCSRRCCTRWHHHLLQLQQRLELLLQQCPGREMSPLLTLLYYALTTIRAAADQHDGLCTDRTTRPQP